MRCHSEEHRRLLMFSTGDWRYEANISSLLLEELELDLHTKKVRYSEVMLLLHSIDTVCSTVERIENTHADHPQKSKPSYTGIVTANPHKANLVCFNTDHIISIHCSQLSLSDSISSSLKMNRKLKFQRSAVRINQWRQINVH